MGKILGMLYGFFGFLAGLVLSFIAVVGSIVGMNLTESAEPLLGIFIGVGAVIVLPLFYGTIGFLSGLLTAGIYNIIARFVGGLEIEFEENAE